MHAHALEILEGFLKPGAHVLDVGSGSGYLAACMAEMVGLTGKVVGIEHIDNLVEMSRRNVENDHPEFLEDGRLKLMVGDGRQGYPEEAPYDAIHVGAAAEPVPQELLNQLKAPGRMVIPVGGEHDDQVLCQYDKDQSGKVTRKALMGVMYVPLTSKEHQVGRN
ncbi:Protein-L-isoaspartate(D-aspartate) O-methyltransferase [Quaeritorhiza haematococci]|nr:Protein-L-isoaspartate(D-aspartate) O-methyltransferase [Quaeritorhiza haematococci]